MASLDKMAVMASPVAQATVALPAATAVTATLAVTVEVEIVEPPAL